MKKIGLSLITVLSLGIFTNLSATDLIKNNIDKKEEIKDTLSSSVKQELMKNIKKLPIFSEVPADIQIIDIKKITQTDLYVKIKITVTIPQKNGQYKKISKLGYATILDGGSHVVFQSPLNSYTKQPSNFFDKSKYIEGKYKAYSIGTGQKRYVVFTDPNCPFCHKLEDKIFNELNLKEYRFDVYYAPILELHPTADRAAQYILSGKTTAEKIKRVKYIKNGREVPLSFIPTKQVLDLYKKQVEIGVEEGIVETPTVIDLDLGVKINWTELK